MTTISQSIRAAALSFPLGFFGEVESAILDYAFNTIWNVSMPQLFVNDEVRARTFCLLVAHALES